MSKIYYFMTITVGLTILMKLAGIVYPGVNQLIDLFGLDPANITVSTSFFLITLAISFGVAATLGSIFSKESSVRAGLIIAIGIMGMGLGTFVGLLLYVKDLATGTQEWVYYVTFMIVAVYIVGYIIALIEFWGGSG